jgi:hypothetical protein
VSHKGHPQCIHSSMAACERARKAELGKCTELTQDKKQPTQCVRWGTGLVGGRSMCDMHAGMVIEREVQARIATETKQRVNDRIDAYLKGIGLTPHVCGERCEFSGIG